MFWLPRLISHACVVWCRVLVSRFRVFQQPLSWFRAVLPPLDTPLILRPYGKMNGIIMSPSLASTRNTMIWPGCLVFIYISTSCRNRTSVSLPSDPDRNVLIWEKSKHVHLKGMLEFVQKLGITFFPLIIKGL